jgi:uncharacterized protein (TIRG00374 family)
MMDQKNHRRHRVRKWITTTLKILIAVVGLWYVISRISWSDRVIIPRGMVIRNVTFVHPAVVELLGWRGKLARVRFKNQTITVRLPSGRVVRGLATRAPLDFPSVLLLPRNYLAHSSGKLEIKFGLEHLLTTANPWPLVAALLLLGLPFLITTWRWRKLLAVQGLNLSYGKCLTLTFVGQFYSTFLPGTTSGDVVKIIYTGRITGQKTKSAITVLLDRVIGLVGLMIVGGLAAGGQLLLDLTYRRAGVGRSADPLLLHVLGLIALLLLALGAGAMVYFSTRLRRWLGMDALLARLPLPEFIKHADRTLRAYRGHKGVLAATLLASMVSQALLPLAGWLAGQAFGMRAPFGFYMAYIPVAVLASSLPIVPPQGLGVLDALILHFFVIRGVDTASQAFALAQAIRFMPIFWNMLGAYWVVHDHYSRPHLESLQELAPENGAAAPAGM